MKLEQIFELHRKIFESAGFVLPLPGPPPTDPDKGYCYECGAEWFDETEYDREWRMLHEV